MGSMQPGLLDRARAWSSILNQFFNGKRDLNAVFGYRNVITTQDILFKYERQDIASRVIEAEPRATWSTPPSPTADDSFAAKWQDVASRTNLFHNIYRADTMVGMHSYVGLLLGFDDGTDLSQPVAEGQVKNLLYVQPYSSDNLRVTDLEGDERSPNFAQPVMYSLEQPTVVAGIKRLFTKRSTNVHASRVIHIAENTLENSIFGSPRVVRTFNVLDDMLKVAGGSAETYWLTANRGMQADIDKDMNLSPDDAEELTEEIEEYQHQLRRFIRTRGVTIKDLGGEVVDPHGVFTVLVSLLAAASGIPQRILLGAEAGQLASAQDRANWAVRIEERRQLFAEPVILNPFVRRLVMAGVLPIPQKLAWNWPDAFRQSPLERAQTGAQRARTLANVAKALSDENPPIDRDEGRKIIGLDEPEPIFNDPGDVQVK